MRGGSGEPPELLAQSTQPGPPLCPAVTISQTGDLISFTVVLTNMLNNYALIILHLILSKSSAIISQIFSIFQWTFYTLA